MANGPMILGQQPPEFGLLFGENESPEAQDIFRSAPGNIASGVGDVSLRTLGLVGDIPASFLNLIMKEENKFKTQFSPEGNVNPFFGYNFLQDVGKVGSNVVSGIADVAGIETNPETIVKNITNADNTSSAPSAKNINTDSPIGKMTTILGGLKDQGVSADERAEIASRMLRPFLSNQTQSKADFEKASAEREARLAKADEKESTEKSSDKSDNLGAYMELARQEGAKGGAVKLRAQQLKEADEREAAKFEQQSELLSQLNPTQLTYLMGQLGYNITPKQTETTTTTPITPTETPEFNTKEEADAAGLKIGTRVKIGGRDAIIT